MDKEYVMRVAATIREQLVTMTDTPEHFMDDLKKYGYIKG